jgi:hypothetical protein
MNNDISLPHACFYFMVDRIDLCEGVLSMREMMQRYTKRRKAAEL